ncbi:MAG: hypothetical protein WDN28_10345 [Chthoniobacter sp.]
MIRHSTSFYCRRCGQVRQFTKRGIDPHLHLIATILSLGSWGFAWLFLYYRDQCRSWRCAICRGRQRPTEEPPAMSAPRVPLTAIPLAPRR